MGGSGSFYSIFYFSVFCTLVWLAGNIFLRLGANDQVPTILAGVALGPYGAKLLPESYATCRAKETMAADNREFIYQMNQQFGTKCNDAQYLADEGYADADKCLEKKSEKTRITECLTYPDVFTVIGHLGVSLLIFRAGLHFDPYGSTEVLKESMIHGFLGTAFPAAIGYAFVVFWFDSAKEEPSLSAWAVGASLAPTSIGMAIKLLLDSGMAATEFGQGVIMGSLIDDIFALGLFEVLQAAVENDGKVKAKTIAKSCLGFVFCLGGVVLALGGWKKIIESPANAIAKKYPPGLVKDDFGNAIPTRFPPEHQFIIFTMFIVLIANSYLTAKFGSHLWGCFMTGIMYAPVGKALKIWRYQTKKLQAWFLRFFFAGSIGFSLNVNALMDVEAVWKGLILGVAGSVGGKHLAGFWLGEEKWVVGWAMTCRAEFAYMVAQICFWKGMMSEKMFSITLWSLFLATLTGPVGYDYCLRTLKKKDSHVLKVEASENARMQPGSAEAQSAVVRPDPVGDLAKGMGGSGASVFRKGGGSQVAGVGGIDPVAAGKEEEAQLAAKKEENNKEIRTS